MSVDQLEQGNAHRLFDIARRIHMAAEAIYLGAGISRAANPGKPAGAAPQDRRYDRDRLDIVDCRRAAIETDLRREGRFEARLALAAFEALQEAGFFAADIGARPAMQVELEIPAGTASVLADETGLVGLVDRGLQALRLVIELAADIDVAGVNPHPDRGEKATFDQLVRVVAEDVAVLAGAGLALVSVDAEIGRAVALFRHERPFEARRKTGPATPAQPGFLDLLDDPVAAFEDELLGAVPIPSAPRARQPPIIAAIEVGEDTILVGKHGECPANSRHPRESGGPGVGGEDDAVAGSPLSRE